MLLPLSISCYALLLCVPLTANMLGIWGHLGKFLTGPILYCDTTATGHQIYLVRFSLSEMSLNSSIGNMVSMWYRWNLKVLTCLAIQKKKTVTLLETKLSKKNNVNMLPQTSTYWEQRHQTYRNVLHTEDLLLSVSEKLVEIEDRACRDSLLIFNLKEGSEGSNLLAYLADKMSRWFPVFASNHSGYHESTSPRCAATLWSRWWHRCTDYLSYLVTQNFLP